RVESVSHERIPSWASSRMVVSLRRSLGPPEIDSLIRPETFSVSWRDPRTTVRPDPRACRVCPGGTCRPGVVPLEGRVGPPAKVRAILGKGCRAPLADFYCPCDGTKTLAFRRILQVLRCAAMMSGHGTLLHGAAQPV